jgi:hypothetical protein
MDTYELKKFSRVCYYVCLGLVAVLGILCVVCNVTGIHLAGRLPGECVLHMTTGLYCPGCGGTRATDALLRGHWIQSLYYHPVVVYTVVMMLAYMISHTLNILTHEKIKAMMFRPWYFYVMIGIILIQWIVKNAIYIATGVQII